MTDLTKKMKEMNWVFQKGIVMSENNATVKDCMDILKSAKAGDTITMPSGEKLVLVKRKGFR